MNGADSFDFRNLMMINPVLALLERTIKKDMTNFRYEMRFHEDETQDQLYFLRRNLLRSICHNQKSGTSRESNLRRFQIEETAY